MFKVFEEVTLKLNQNLNVIPLLYGSLGFETRTGYTMDPKDIDLLLPKRFFNEQWFGLITLMDELGFELVDLQEREFRRGDTSVAFSDFEELNDFVGIEFESIEILKESDIEFLLLNEEQYLKVYSKSILDSYRKDKNNGKDLMKIEILKSIL